jgi:hypothetical protein
VQKLPPVDVTPPFPIPHETALLLHTALDGVVRSSALSMADLRECVVACVRCLRASSVGPAQMIISVKACAREASKRHPMLDSHQSSNAEFLMDVIVKWAIIEYYRDA